METVPFFLNPQARSARAGKLRKWLQKHHEAFTVVEPASPADLENYLRQHVAKKTPLVAIGGGDGTMSVAAEILRGSETKLAIFPSGTANVFALELGIPSGDYDTAWEVMKAGRVKAVDLFEMNGHPFVQMAGIGFDARAVELTTWELKKKWGPFSYVMSGLKALREELPTLKLTLPNGETIQAHSLLFGNGRHYGGPLSLFGDADHSDRKLDIIALKAPIPRSLWAICQGILRGGLRVGGNDVFEYVQAEACRVDVMSGGSVACERDGDFVGYAPVAITRSPHPLNVCSAL